MPKNIPRCQPDKHSNIQIHIADTLWADGSELLQPPPVVRAVPVAPLMSPMPFFSSFNGKRNGIQKTPHPHS